MKRPSFAQRLRTAMRAFRSGFAGGSMGGYAAAGGGRLLADWFASIASADQETTGDLRILRARSRELARNDGYFKHYLRLLLVNVLGATGPRLQCQVRNNSGELARPLNTRIEQAFAEWAKRPTVDRRMTLAAARRVALRAVAMDGEVFVRLVTGYRNRFGFALQLIDADRVDHTYNRAAGNGLNEIRCGIEIDSWGAPVAYWIWTKHPADTSLSTVTQPQRERVPAEQIIHLYDPERVSQTRGVPWAAAAMWPTNMLRGYEHTELVAARTGAAKMGWFQFKDTAEVEPFDPKKDAVNVEADAGTIGFVPPGMEFKDWSPEHPAQAFGAFVKQCLRRIASGFGLNYSGLANDLENVNLSSIRFGLQAERDEWRAKQAWWGSAFEQPVYEAWLFAALAQEALVLDSRAPSRFYAVRWRFRGWAHMDPKVEVEAAVLRIQHGLASRQMVLDETGDDFEEILEQQEAEQLLASQYDVSITPAASAPPAAADSDAPATDRAASRVLPLRLAAPRTP